MSLEQARENMLQSQVRVNDVTHRDLQSAFRETPREAFVPAERAYSVYGELEVEIASGRYLMRAREIAKLLQALDPKTGETALAIAAPYAAAVLAHAGVSVTAQEADAKVAAIVGPALQEAGVALVVQDLKTPVAGGYDMIVSEGAVVTAPEAWLAALKVGGRLALVEQHGPVGRARLYVRTRSGFSARDVFDATATQLPGFEKTPAFVL